MKLCKINEAVQNKQSKINEAVVKMLTEKIAR